jgi:hypothetical protein
VTWIAEQCAVKDDLGKKGTAGILQDMPQELRFCRMKATEFDLLIRRSIAHGSIRLKSGLAQVAPFAQFKSTDELKRTTFEVYCVFQRNAG